MSQPSDPIPPESVPPELDATEPDESLDPVDPDAPIDPEDVPPITGWRLSASHARALQ